MSQAVQKTESVPNHTIDPATGFVESLGYASAFDAQRKIKFLEVFRTQGLGLYRTCRALGLSTSTIHQHYRIDPVFKQLYDEAKTEYTDELEATSRVNALNPKSVIERIFQLKALLPEKYGDQKNSQPPQITINIDSKLIEDARDRAKILDVDQIVEGQVVASANQEGDRRITPADPVESDHTPSVSSTSTDNG